MKSKLLPRKQTNKTCVTLLVFAAVGGACALIAFHLKKQRVLLCSKQKGGASITCKTGARPVSVGCQHLGQNEAVPGKTDMGANSSEWERGIS